MIQWNEEPIEIKGRLQAENKCYYGLSKLLKAKMMSNNLKVQVCRTLIRP